MKTKNEDIYRRIKGLLGKKIYGRYLTVGLVLLASIILVSVAFGAVFIVYQYDISTTPTSLPIYLEDGPNYAEAAALGLVGPTANSQIASGATLYINGVSGSADVYLLNVFQVINSTSSSQVKGHVYLYINGTLPSGVTLYFDNTTQMTFSGTDSGLYGIGQGTGAGNGSLVGAGSSSYLSSGPIPLTGTYTLYISFLVSGTASGSGSLYFQLSVS